MLKRTGGIDAAGAGEGVVRAGEENPRDPSPSMRNPTDEGAAG
jgi:hypothetical protein